MSDRVTNAEVEDVLSSIRRLVSQKSKPEQSPVAAVPAESPADDKLVLTPQLRVDSPDELEPRAEPPSIESLVTDDTPLDVYTAVPQDTAGPDEEALVTAAQYDPETVEDVSTVEEAPMAIDVPQDDAVDSDPVVAELDHEAETEAILTDDPSDGAEVALASEDVMDPDDGVAVPDVKAEALSAKIAALETAIGKISDTWEPDDVGESDYAGTQGQTMSWEDDAPESKMGQKPLLAPVSRRLGASQDPQDEDLDEDEAAPAFQAFTSQRKSQPRFHPAPESTTQSLAEDVQDPEDRDDAPQTPALQDEAQEVAAVEPTPDSAPADLGAEDHLLDEEALRDLISEIVRSELQGALGERITRNVRKLVRREINRALAAQDLD